MTLRELYGLILAPSQYFKPVTLNCTQAPGHYYKPLTTTTSLQCCYYLFLPLTPQLHSSAPLPPTPLLGLRPHSTAPTVHAYSTTGLTWTLTKPLTGPAAQSGLGVGPAC